MSRSDLQYLRKLDFLIGTARVFDPEPYERPVEEWSRQEKSHLTRLYNKARLSTSTQDLAKRPSPEAYAEMARLIRPFAKGFNAKSGYNLNRPDKWSAAQKGKLTRYYKEAVMLASRPFQVYRPPTKEHAAIAREAAGMSKGYPAFRGILMPVQTLEGDAKIKVNLKTRTVQTQTATHQTTQVFWDQYNIGLDDIANDPEGAVEVVTDDLGMRLYSIMAGEHAVGKGVPRLYTPNQAKAAVARLTAKYGEENYDPEDTNSHYFGNWMHGITGYQFRTRKDRDKWVSRSREETTARKRYKNLVRRRMRYAREQASGVKRCPKCGMIGGRHRKGCPRSRTKQRVK